ncbi:MAG: hypothetical protein LIO63_01780 [Akkermansia sp.]|nr:hypothetical protein [Akkermansia sp.]MCD8070086.1 hypothetical protein [Akkermansiaceae bacterium]
MPMYIPTQKERYSKAALGTLLLCVIIPPAVILYLKGITDLFDISLAFTLPLALFFQTLCVPPGAATWLSFILQVFLFILLACRTNWTPKTRMTVAITWGMISALAVKIIIPCITS